MVVCLFKNESTELNSVKIKDRLKLFLSEKNISEGKFEKLVGVSNGFVTKVGDSIRTVNLSKIKEKYPELNTTWLLTGEGDMLVNTEPKTERKSSGTPNGRRLGPDEDWGTPIFDISATAGGIDNINQLPEVPSFHVKVPGYEDCNFGMYVFGHSMYPTIETGSLILCRKINNKQLIMYGEIYLVRTADYFMVKRLQKSTEPGCVLCTSDNYEQRSNDFKRFEPFDLPIDTILDLYLVKGIIKKTQS